jgi:hypothetical protein
MTLNDIELAGRPHLLLDPVGELHRDREPAVGADLLAHTGGGRHQTRIHLVLDVGGLHGQEEFPERGPGRRFGPVAPDRDPLRLPVARRAGRGGGRALELHLLVGLLERRPQRVAFRLQGLPLRVLLGGQRLVAGDLVDGVHLRGHRLDLGGELGRTAREGHGEDGHGHRGAVPDRLGQSGRQGGQEVVEGRDGRRRVGHDLGAEAGPERAGRQQQQGDGAEREANREGSGLHCRSPAESGRVGRRPGMWREG